MTIVFRSQLSPDDFDALGRQGFDLSYECEADALREKLFINGDLDGFRAFLEANDCEPPCWGD